MNVNDEDFDEEVLEKSKQMPVVVDFWAPWCGPCLMLKPLMEKLAKDYEGKVAIVTLNVDENSETAEKYDIMSIPSIKMFKNGQIVDEFSGVRPEDYICEWIDAQL